MSEQYFTTYCATCGKPKPFGGPSLCTCIATISVSQDIVYTPYSLTAEDRKQIRAIVAEEIAKVLSIEKIANEVVKRIAQDMKKQGGSRGW